MKKLLSALLAVGAVLTAAAYESSSVDYSQNVSGSTTFSLVWVYDLETFGSSTCAVITGVKNYDSGSDTVTPHPFGAIAVPESITHSDGIGYLVKGVADGAFADQIGLTSVSIPITVERLGVRLFTGCTLLSEISVDAGNPWFSSYNGLLYDKDREKLYACPATAESVILPNSLTEIAEEAFAGCHRLRSITIPANVTTIGAHAFRNCPRLNSITFSGNQPTTVGADPFDGSLPLTIYIPADNDSWSGVPGTWNGAAVASTTGGEASGTLSAESGFVTWHYRVVNGRAELYRNGDSCIEGDVIETFHIDKDTGAKVGDDVLNVPSALGGYPVTSIGPDAFRGCSAITKIALPDSITKIGAEAFAGCTGLTTLELPSTVREIGRHPFTGSSLTALALPDQLRVLDGNPMAGCDTLLSVSISGDNSYFAVVNGLLYDKDVRTLIGCPARKEAPSVASSTLVIGDEAFLGCFRLSNLILPENLVSIGASAFQGCVRLSSLVFPASIKTLKDERMFDGCVKLEFLGFSGDAPAVDPALLAGTPADTKIYVSQNTKGWNGDPVSPALPASGKWPAADANGRTIENLDVSAEADLKEGDVFTLINTNGTMYAWTLKVLANRGVEILGVSPKPIGSFAVPSEFDSVLGILTVKKVGDRLLANSSGLLSVSFPDTVTEIGSNVFANCDVLASVTLNYGLRRLGWHPFDGTAIKTIAIPDTVQYIDGNPLYGCSPSTGFSVSKDNPYFSVSSEGALYDKDFTTLIAVPMTVEAIDIPASVTAFAAECFYNCLRLKKVTFNGDAPTAADGDDLYLYAHASLTNFVFLGNTTFGTLPGIWHIRPAVYWGEEPVEEEGAFKFRIVDGYAEIYNNGNAAIDPGTSGKIEVPANLGGYPVKKIGEGAFRGCSSLTEVDLPATVTEIGDRAFYGCGALETIGLPSALTTIGVEPFYGTYLRSIELPARVSSLNGNPGVGCAYLRSITVDADNRDFRAEKGILFNHDQTLLIGCQAYATEVAVPATVAGISSGAFSCCRDLVRVTFDGNAPVCDADLYADAPNVVTYANEAATGFTDGTWKSRPIIRIASGEIHGDILSDGIWHYCLDSDGHAMIYNNGSCALVNPNTIGSVSIPASIDGHIVISVGNQALKDCVGITEVALPETVTKLGNEVFSGCAVLSTVTLNNGLRTIGRHPFAGTAIETIAIPDTVTAIDGNLLYGCSPSTGISISDANPYFAVSSEGALYDKDLTTLLAVPMTAQAIEVPASVTAFGAECFYGCLRLQAVVFNGDAPTAADGDDLYLDTHATMTNFVFLGNTTFGAVPGTWHLRPTARWGEEPVEEEGLFKFRIVGGAYAEIYNNGNAAIDPSTTGDINVPDTLGGYPVKRIGEGAFLNCAGLTSVKLPSIITAIGDHAFSGCESLAEIDLPSSLRAIGFEPFRSTGLGSLNLPKSVTSLDGNPAAGCDWLNSITVDENSKNFAVLNGLLCDLEQTTLFCCNAYTREVTVPASVATIVSNAFSCCRLLKRVTFEGDAPVCDDDLYTDAPNVVTYANEAAAGFTAGTWKNRPIVLVESGEIHGDILSDGTWYYCLDAGGRATIYNGGSCALVNPSTVGNVSIPASIDGHVVTTVGNQALKDCVGITDVSFPSTVTKLGNEVFSGCAVLASVTLNNGLRTIGRHPFAGTAIQTIAIPDTVETIDGNILYDCRPSTSFSISGTNPYFAVSPEGALYDKDFTTLFAVPMTVEELVVPETVTNFAEECFRGCLRLKKVNFNGDAPTAADGDDLYLDAHTSMTNFVFLGNTTFGAIPGTWHLRPAVYWGEPPVEEEGIFKFRIVGGKYAEIYNNGNAATDPLTIGDVTIPDTLGGYPVRRIGDGAFKDCENITAIKFPAALTEIGKRPFEGTKITSLSIPSAVSAIDGNPAYGCRYLSSISVDPQNRDFTAADGILYDYEKTTLIGCQPYATEITVPKTVAAISSGAFSRCSTLRKITFEGSAPVCNDDDTVFTDCHSALILYIPAGNTSFGVLPGTWHLRPTLATGVDPSEAIHIGLGSDGRSWHYRLRNGIAELYNNGSCALDGGENETTITLPVKVDGYLVKTVGECAFANCRGIQAIGIPAGYEYINSYAFSNCTSLATITIPYGVRYIGERVFVNTVLTSIDLPDSLFEMGGNIAAGCLNQLTINIGADESHFTLSSDGVLYNKDMTKLYSCPARMEGTVMIPESVTNICQDAFFGCFRLTYLNLPAKVNTIGKGAFNVGGIWPDMVWKNAQASESTPRLESVFYNGPVPNAADDIYDGAPADLVNYVFDPSWSTVGTTWKNRAVNLIDSANPPILTYRDGELTWRYRIINSLVEICGILPKSTAGNITDADGILLAIPATINGYSVSAIETNAFEGCAGITRVGIPSSVREIRDYAFKGCQALTTIGLYNMQFDGTMTAVEIQTGVTRIGYHAFDGIGALSFAIPYTVKEMDGNPLAGCQNAANVTIDANNPYFYASGNIIYNRRLTELVGVPANFNGASVTLPSTVTAIGKEAFYGCFNLDSIQLPDGMKTIGDNAFFGCSSIAKMTMPAAVSEIGSLAFNGCSSLTNVTFLGDAPTAADDIYSGTPSGLVSVADPGHGFSGTTWKGRPLYVNTPDDPIVDDRLSITDSSGITWYYRVVDNAAEIWNNGNCAVSSEKAITSLTVPGTIGPYVVNAIGEGALAGLGGISAIGLPDTISVIGNGALRGCGNLAAITLPDALTTIGSRPFEGTKLAALSIPSSVSAIDGNPAYGCKYLNSITVDPLNRDFKSIDGLLYDYRMTRLIGCQPYATEIVIPASVTEIADGAFSCCLDLASVSFEGNAPACNDDLYADSPDVKTYVAETATGFTEGTWKGRPITSVTGSLSGDDPVGPQSFNDGDGVTWLYTVENGVARLGLYGETPVIANPDYSGELTIPDELDGYPVRSVPDNALANCTNITKVTVSAGIRELGNGIFNGCTGLSSIYVANGNQAYSSKYNCLYSKDGRTLVKVPAKFRFATAITQTISGVNQDIVEQISPINTESGLVNPAPNTVTVLKTYTATTSVTTVEFTPAISTENLLNGVTTIADYALTDCGRIAADETANGTAIVKSNGETIQTLTGNFAMPIGTEASSSNGVVVLSSKAGFYPEGSSSVALYKTIVNGQTSISAATPFCIPEAVTTIAENAFAGSHFTEIKRITPASGTVPEDTPGQISAPSTPGSIDHTLNLGSQGISSAAQAPYETGTAIYDGYLYENGILKGTLQVKIAKGKRNRKSNQFEAKVTATVLLADSAKKLSFKNGLADEIGTITPMQTGGWTLSTAVSMNGLDGLLANGSTTYLIDGTRNLFSATDSASKAASSQTLAVYQGAYNLIWNDGYLSISIAAKGKVKIAGMLNGSKISASSQLLVGDGRVCVPVVINKKASLTFNLWIENGLAEIANASKELPGLICGRAGARIGSIIIMDELPPGYFRFENAKDEAMKLKLNAKTGEIKGSFKLAMSDNRGKAKKVSVSVVGIQIEGTGYCTATIKKVGSFQITVR